MGKIILRSYIVPIIKYDLDELDTDKGINVKVNLSINVSKTDKYIKKMNIKTYLYSEEKTPFVELFISGLFDISEKNIEKDTDIERLLRIEGFPILYKKLQDIHSNIQKSADLHYPELPDMDFSE
ncbi:MAG: hypothetical protein HFE49_04615 [Clostridia bacterium]|nr:hypothetical protein [Clostridia bacterium]